MRIAFLACLFIAIGTSSLFATIPSPTNLTVTAMRDSNGQYFHVTFRKLTIPSDSNYSLYYYFIVRWAGAVPDTTKRLGVSYAYQGGDTTAVYNDHSTIFNISPTDTTFSATYSYSVFVRHRSSDTSHGITYDSSALMTPVSAMLDTVTMKFTQVVNSTENGTIGDTVRGTFVAVESSGNSWIHYHITANSGPAVGAIDSITGAFWAVQTTALTSASSNTRFAINAYDDAGRTVQVRYYLLINAPLDTITVTLIDSTTGNPISYTDCYTALVPAVNDSASHGFSAIYNSTITYHYGQVTISCVNGVYKLRIGAEGYVAQWVNDPKGNSVISASGSDTIYLVRAQTYTISGTAYGPNDSLISGVVINAYRTYGANSYHYALDTVTTDANGYYSCTIPAGDSTLGTNGVFVLGTAKGFLDSVQWYHDPLTTTTRTWIALNENQDSINFSFYHVAPPPEQHSYLYVELSGTPAHDTLLAIYATLSVYRLVDSGTPNYRMILYQTDTMSAGIKLLALPFGKYVFFATPTDSNYFSGYYSPGVYAATWQDADTFAVNSTARTVIYIELERDSSVTPHHGTSITGAVQTPAGGGLAGTHLLLYKIVGAPAGSDGKALVKTTMTNGSGQFGFGKVGVGLYEIYIDIVGVSPYLLGGFNVDSTGTPIQKNFTYGTSAVQNTGMILPDDLHLAQNYPNPFAGTTFISFAVPVQENISVVVYDAIGREVAQLANGVHSAGTYVAPFNAANLPAGTYNYVLRMNGTTERKMMQLTR